MPARWAVVRGYVQGVGFRAYVADLADRLGVVGEVWNRTDGAVEARFEHNDPAVLEEFVRMLWNGPGKVDAIESSELDGTLNCSDFEIGPKR